MQIDYSIISSYKYNTVYNYTTHRKTDTILYHAVDGKCAKCTNYYQNIKTLWQAQPSLQSIHLLMSVSAGWIDKVLILRVALLLTASWRGAMRKSLSVWRQLVSVQPHVLLHLFRVLTALQGDTDVLRGSCQDRSLLTPGLLFQLEFQLRKCCLRN